MVHAARQMGKGAVTDFGCTSTHLDALDNRN
jgi:hypothetical protein